MLAKELDGFPLALATAGAYLDQVAISFSDYLRLYRTSWSKLQKTSPELTSYEDRTLYSTWQVSFDHVKQQNELSVKLLRLWAYFDNEDIWFELLRHSDAEDPEWIRELTKDEIIFNSAVRVLCDHGLVEADMSSQEWTESKGYSMHGCVYSWTVDVLNQEWDYELAKLAVKLVASHVPEREKDKLWITERRLLQHAARSLYIILNEKIVDGGIEWVYYNLGLLYASQSKLKEAEEMYQRALQGKEKALGANHISTLNTVNNLGNLYIDQGKLKEAEEMYQRALQATEKALGADHISTLDTVNNLGCLYYSQGKLKEAEEMYQRALQGYKKTLGRERLDHHLPTLNTLENYGNLLVETGSTDQAEEFLRRALSGLTEIIGLRSERCQRITSTLNTLRNTATSNPPKVGKKPRWFLKFLRRTQSRR
jgi:tetratricopeptide (TPR) repeat protein